MGAEFLESIRLEHLLAASVAFFGVFVLFVVGLLALSLLHQRREKNQVVERLQPRRSTGGTGEPATRAVSVLIEEEARDQLSGLLRSLSVGRALQRLLASSGSDLSAGAFAIRLTSLGLVLGGLAGLATRSAMFMGIFFLVGASLPVLKENRKAKGRIRKFEEGFPDAIDLLTRALQAGHPFSSGLKMVATESQEPLKSEFRQMFEEQKYGMPVDLSLRRFAERMNLLDVNIFVTAILVQREVGGELSEILGNISTTVRERFVIRRQVQTYTAQGRMTGYMLGALPFIIGLAMYFMNPENISIFWTDLRGQALFAGAVLMQIIGLLIIRKIIAIDI